jgi:UDPglucose 6-dehydrogenase
MNLNKYIKLMKNLIIIDGRNCYDLLSAKQANIIYDSIGRETINSLEASLVYIK